MSTAENKFRLIAFLQTLEDYSDTDVPYWKFKGGIDILVQELTLQEAIAGRPALEAIINAKLPQINHRATADGYRAYMVGWELLAPGELTGDEKLAQEYYDGFWDGHPVALADWVRG